MKVCIDGIGLSMLRGTSLYSYTYEFLNNLFEMYPNNNYEIIWDNTKVNWPLKNIKGLSYINLDLNRADNDYSKLEQHILENKVDIFHSINNGLSIPLNKKCKNISTVYDLLPIVDMSYTDKKYYEKFMNVFPNAINKSDKIIAVSHFIKDQIIEYFNVNKEKIEVIYPGCSEGFKEIRKDICREFLKNNYNIQGEFLLYVGSIHPRKNLHVLLNILKEIKKYDCTRDMKLVIVGKYDGKRYEYYSKLRTMLRFLSIEDSVVFTGVVEYENMIYFYNGAECLINLSLYDGFPLSVLEAMACKAPVICNDNSLFEEIIKDGGILVDYHDETYIKEVILELLLNSNFRISIAEKGRQLSKIYTWKKAIQKTVEIYK